MTLSMIKKFFGIVFSPPIGWLKADFTGLSYKDFVVRHVLPAMAVFFAFDIVGKSLSLLSTTDFVDIIIRCCLDFVVYLLPFLVTVSVTNAILPYYGIKKSTLKVGTFFFITLIPVYIGIITFYIFPSLLFLSILVSIYSLFVGYWGIVNYLRIKKIEDIIIFYIISLIILIGVFILLNFLKGTLLALIL